MKFLLYSLEKVIFAILQFLLQNPLTNKPYDMIHLGDDVGSDFLYRSSIINTSSGSLIMEWLKNFDGRKFGRKVTVDSTKLKSGERPLRKR